MGSEMYYPLKTRRPKRDVRTSMLRCVASRNIRGTICHRVNAFRLARCVSPVPALPNKNPHASANARDVMVSMFNFGQLRGNKVKSTAESRPTDGQVLS